jgi:uncharacterized protein (TIGR00251 family)
MLIKVKVFPNSKKEEIIKKSKDSFEIKIKEKPVMGRANREAVEILVSFFNVQESKVRLIRGAKKRNKIFDINLDKN